MTTEIILLIGCIVLLSVLVVLSGYTIHRDTTKMQNNLQLQIAAASAAKKPEIHKLPYAELMKIVNNTIDYYTSQNMEILSFANKSPEEISLVINDLTIEISTKVETSISPVVYDVITSYVTEEFFSRYIFNSVQALIVLNIEKQKKTMESQQRKIQKTVEQKEK
jgi:hypothetical protein